MVRVKGEREHYFFIDSLRSVACFLVVFHHCLGYFPTASFAGYYLTYLKPFFPTVTLYLLVSGFVHASVIERKAQSYGSYVWDKFNRIMVPYFSISLITLVIRLVAERSHVIALDEIQYTPFVWGHAGLRILFSGVEGHYYFLELLFLYLLVFPFLVRRLGKPREALAVLALVLAVDPFLASLYGRSQSPIWSPVALLGATLSGFKFFLFGFVLNRFYATSIDLIEKRGAALGVVCLASFAYLHWTVPSWNEYWVFLELFAYFCLARVFFSKPIEIVAQISTLSFGIYLLHQPYFIKLSRLWLAPFAGHPDIQLFSTWGLTVLLTTLATKALDSSPFFARWILGKPHRESERARTREGAPTLGERESLRIAGPVQ